MNIAPQPLRERRIPRSPRSRRQRAAAASLASGVAVAAAVAIVFGAVLGPGQAGTSPLLAGFGARSYAPGQVAVLNIGGGDTNRATLQIFQAGASGTPGAAAASGWDKHTFGKPVTAPQQVRRPSGERSLARARPPRLELGERGLRRPPDLGRTHRLRAVRPPAEPARHGARARRGADEHLARVRRGGRRQLVPRLVRPRHRPRPIRSPAPG